MSCELTTFSISLAEQVVLNRGLFHLQARTPEAEVKSVFIDLYSETNFLIIFIYQHSVEVVRKMSFDCWKL